MSSPVHQPKHLDTALRYAPPWARQPKSAAPSLDDRSVATSMRDPAGDSDMPSFIGDRAMLRLRRRLSLDPDIVPLPSDALDGSLPVERIAIRLCAVAGVAALIAWAIVALPVSRAADGEIAAAPAAQSVAVNRVRLVHVRGAMAPISVLHTAFALAHKLPPQMQEPHLAPPVENASSVPPRAEAIAKATAAPAGGNAQRPLDGEEIAALIKRGKDYLMNGDVASARLLLRRAADAGNAEAALALGATFDPLVVKQLGAIGVATDAAEARKWYKKAEASGLSAASQQLAKLAAAPQ